MTVWLLILWGAAEVTVAPQQFASLSDCQAVLAQVPRTAGSGKCVEARVK